VKSLIDTYANATFVVIPKVRNSFGRWDYDLDVPTPDTRSTGRCRTAQGNRLVEGVNGNVRALEVLCSTEVALDVDDRLLITMDDTELAKSACYSIIGVARSATLDGKVKSQKLTCIEAGVTVAENVVVPPPLVDP
jgi:hypothetical protein